LNIKHLFLFLIKAIYVGFEQTTYVINEPEQLIKIPIVRTGDLSQSFSVMCHTRPMTAIDEKDYIGKYSLEQSRIYFGPGERQKECLIEIVNDSVFEADEEFQVKLSDLRGPEDAKLNQFTTAIVKILNNEDSAVISFAENTYDTEEPSSNDASIIKSITVLRTGDLSRTSIVRVSTSDNTAIAGVDYKPKTETITFLPGISAMDFDVEIFYDKLNEPNEMFFVNLGPQDPVAAIFGKWITANVLIKDSNDATNSSSSKNLMNDQTVFAKALPYVISLQYYLDQLNKSQSANQRGDQQSFAPADVPLICFHVSFWKNIKFII
jgi:hypothetical protein